MFAKCKLLKGAVSMKVKITGIVFLTLLLTAIASVASNESAKPIQTSPKIVITQHTFEFPKIVEGTLVSHDFLVENRGNAELIIKKVKTG
jgi:hypothetical protein